MGFVALVRKIIISVVWVGLGSCVGLHSEAGEVNKAGVHVLSPTHRPIVFRSYLRHQNQKRLHVISVGDPAGIHYAVDIKQGSLLQVWDGGFLDVTPIWTDRGMEPDSRLLDEPDPLGRVLELTADPPLAFLNQSEQTWPRSLKENEFEFKGYHLDSQGRPTFHYRLDKVTVYDRLRPSHGNRALTRQWTIQNEHDHDARTLWCFLAAGTKITQLARDRFSFNDGSYMISVPTATADVCRIRTSDGRQELSMPVLLDSPERTVSYTIIW